MDRKKDPDNYFTVKAEILKYHVNDLHYDYDDGTGEWFDSTSLKMLDPASEEIFYVFHRNAQKSNSLWRKAGLLVNLRIEKEYYDVKKQKVDEFLFSDNLVIVEESGE